MSSHNEVVIGMIVVEMHHCLRNLTLSLPISVSLTFIEPSYERLIEHKWNNNEAQLDKSMSSCR